MRLTLNQRIALFDLTWNRKPEASLATLRSLFHRGLIARPNQVWILTVAGVRAINRQNRLAARRARKP